MRPLRSSTYVIGLFAVAALLVAAVGAWMLARMAQVQVAAAESNAQAVREEVHEALSELERAINRQLVVFADWDEVHQQLADPTYYGYWRENRALRAGQLPAYVRAVELYDAGGEALAASQAVPPPLPGHLPERDIYVEARADHIDLLRFVPVAARGAGPSGYLGLRVDLLAALTAVYKFRYADPMSLRIDTGGRSQVPVAELAQVVRLQPRRLPETGALEAVMRDTLVHLGILTVALGALFYLAVVQMLQRPLYRLTRHIEALRSGRSELLGSDVVPLFHVAELETVRQLLNDYQRDLRDMHVSLDQKNQELWRLAHHDPLTGVSNRRAYEEDWRQLLELVRGQRIGITVLLFDCDHFKAINDSYGHDVGDQVLRAVAGTLGSCLRQGDRLYRLGGDEFAVHLVNTDAAEAEAIALRCLDKLAVYPFKDLGIKGLVRFSVGLAHAEGNEPGQLAKLHTLADVAMYQAKRPGSSKVVHYRPEMGGTQEALVSSRYVSAVYQAIESGLGMELHYQPVVSLVQNCPSYYEVLVRLRDEDGLITPGFIFPVVIAEGLQTEFDVAVIRQLAKLLGAGLIPRGTGLSVNIDGLSMTRREIREALEGLKPYLSTQIIILEVTESALITELAEASAILQGLRQAGFRVALDDFGSGYSSLRYLAQMPVDIVKFDITMVHDLERDDSQRRIAENVAHMIRESKYRLVAEGVETAALLARVRELGFTHAQGYLFGKPQERLTAIPDLTGEAMACDADGVAEQGCAPG